MSDNVTPIQLDPEPLVDGELTQRLIDNFHKLDPSGQRLADRFMTAVFLCRDDEVALQLLHRAERQCAVARTQGVDAVSIVRALVDELERRAAMRRR